MYHGAARVALQAPVPMMQGLYVMEKGPFLRSYGTEHTPVSIELDNIADRAGYGRKLQVEPKQVAGGPSTTRRSATRRKSKWQQASRHGKAPAAAAQVMQPLMPY